jgi:hypothetical protein
MTNDKAVALALEALNKIRESLHFANDSPNGAIQDTIWMMHDSETLFDFIDDRIAALSNISEAPAQTMPEGWQAMPIKLTPQMKAVLKNAAPKWNAESIYAALRTIAPQPIQQEQAGRDESYDDDDNWFEDPDMGAR